MNDQILTPEEARDALWNEENLEFRTNDKSEWRRVQAAGLWELQQIRSNQFRRWTPTYTLSEAVAKVKELGEGWEAVNDLDYGPITYDCCKSGLYRMSLKAALSDQWTVRRVK